MTEYSQESSQDTVPHSPRAKAFLTELLAGGDFARLRPANNAARTAFSEIAAKIKHDPENYQLASRCMYIQECQIDQVSERSSSGTDRDRRESPDRIWTGYYCLNLEVLPKEGRLGWSFGSGRVDAAVDFQRTLRSREHGVRGLHGRLRHHSETGVLMLIVDGHKVVWVNGKDKVENSQRAIVLRTTGLAIGNLNYILEFTSLGSRRYREQLSEYLMARGNSGFELPVSLEMTPSVAHFEKDNFVIQSPVGKGAFGVVSPGIDLRNGAAVAVKRVTRTDLNIQKVQNEVSIMRDMGSHPCICSLIAELYSGGHASWTGVHSFDEAYLVSAPLGRHDLGQVYLADVGLQVRLALMRDCIQGLAHLHSHGIMHRDIKLKNLMLISYDPPRAMIIDFGCATRELHSTDDTQGTIALLAPEVLALKHGTTNSPYDRSIDIWSMGLVAFQLLLKQKRSWTDAGIKKDAYSRMRQHKSTQTDEVLVAFVFRLVEWRSDRRLTAQEALHHPIWARYSIDDENITGSKRPAVEPAPDDKVVRSAKFSK